MYKQIKLSTSFLIRSAASGDATGTATTTSSGAAMVADSFGNAKSNVSGRMASNSVSGGYFNEGSSKSNGYIKDKLSGKT